MSRFFCFKRGRLTLLAAVTAGVGVMLVLLLAVLAANPASHNWFHRPQVLPEASHLPDSDEGCIVTTFAQGHFDFHLTPVVIVSLEPILIAIIVAKETLSYPKRDSLLPPGCGPPAA